MNDAEKKALFLEHAEAAANGKDGNLEFTCPLCNGYAIGHKYKLLAKNKN